MNELTFLDALLNLNVGINNIYQTINPESVKCCMLDLVKAEYTLYIDVPNMETIVVLKGKRIYHWTHRPGISPRRCWNYLQFQ